MQNAEYRVEPWNFHCADGGDNVCCAGKMQLASPSGLLVARWLHVGLIRLILLKTCVREKKIISLTSDDRSCLYSVICVLPFVCLPRNDGSTQVE